ncbi:MAG: hypothetical protein V4497_09480 [Bacteroidota bacterium]
MKNLTAMQTLVKELENYKENTGAPLISVDLLIQGLNGIYGQLEKQQIEQAHNDGGLDGDKMGTIYYNETYTNQKPKGE